MHKIKAGKKVAPTQIFPGLGFVARGLLFSGTAVLGVADRGVSSLYGGSVYFAGPWGREEPSRWGIGRVTSRCAPLEVVPLPVGAGGILPCFPVAACLRPHHD